MVLDPGEVVLPAAIADIDRSKMERSGARKRLAEEERLRHEAELREMEGARVERSGFGSGGPLLAIEGGGAAVGTAGAAGTEPLTSAFPTLAPPKKGRLSVTSSKKGAPLSTEDEASASASASATEASPAGGATVLDPDNAATASAAESDEEILESHPLAGAMVTEI